jgi:hypothetical protein
MFCTKGAPDRHGDGATKDTRVGFGIGRGTFCRFAAGFGDVATADADFALAPSAQFPAADGIAFGPAFSRSAYAATAALRSASENR